MSLPVAVIRYPSRAQRRRRRDAVLVRFSAALCGLALLISGWIGVSAAF